MTDIVFKKEDKQITLNEVIDFLTKQIRNKRDDKTVITAEPGRKYIKIVMEYYGQRSVYCFIDFNGNIYKAAAWAAPAKHVRGSIFNENYGWGSALGPYGASYLR